MTERERWWATATVWMEARGEPFEGQIAVAQVICNRMKDPRYPDSAGAVVLQPLQFSAWNHDSPTRRPLAEMSETEEGWGYATMAVLEVFCRRVPDATKGACHYYSMSLPHAPNWDDGTLPRVQIGRHTFVRGVP